MGVFDRHKKRQPPNGSGDNGGLDQLQDLREEVPDIEDTLDRLDRAIVAPLEKESRGCGCFG